MLGYRLTAWLLDSTAAWHRAYQQMRAASRCQLMKEAEHRLVLAATDSVSVLVCTWESED